jgi:DNA-binding transcriptional ArsR family regulator
MAKPKPITNISDPRYAKALAHPLRIRILAMLEEGDASPVVLAKKLDAPLGVVAYHVRTLWNLGLLDLAGTRQRRGATEHTYRVREHPRVTDEAWDALSITAKHRLLGATLQQIGEYVTGSAANGGFDRADAHATRTALRLDDRGWRELAKATKSWLEQVGKIEDGAKKRLAKPGADDDAFDVGLVILLFEALPFARRASAVSRGSASGSRARRGPRRAAVAGR